MRKVERDDLFTAAPLPVAPLDDAQRLACLRLIRSENIGPVTFRALVNQFGGADRALAALPDLARRGGGRRPIRICLREHAEAELAAAVAVGARPVFTIEPGYPPALAVIEAPPPMLYVRGRSELLAGPAVAIVGSRQASAAGHQLARRLAGDLGRAGYVVVSGLARGIDGAAHEAALATGTIAVLAGGVDVIYPPEHAGLHQRIAEEGCLVAEQPPGFQPRGKDFPRRNRVIAGIAYGVVVVEAARRSGSLITARIAAEIGRDVFAVPGHPLDPRAEGTNQLLKDGAMLATSAADIIEALSAQTGLAAHALPPFSPASNDASPRPLSADIADDARAHVLAALGPAPASGDQIARATGLPARVVQIALLELSLAGRLEHHGQQLVSLRSRE